MSSPPHADARAPVAAVSPSRSVATDSGCAVREARPLLAPVVIAVALTFVLAPAVRRLRRFGVPEMLGAALLVLALIGTTLSLSASLAAPAAEWWQKAPTTVAQLLAQFDRLRASIPGLGPPPAHLFFKALAPPPPTRHEQEKRAWPGVRGSWLLREPLERHLVIRGVAAR